ncbi:MAG: T9SS type A sorting domain-containing protein, partial [Bacteroidetes bacterium]|nr:T9SS type A sorting domain-containing protein [Bacteroidota bacterium]
LMDGKTTANEAEAGTWWIKNSIIAGSVSKSLDTTKSNNSINISNWFTVTNGNRVFAENTEAGLVSPFSTSSFNPTPSPNSPVFAGAAVPPADGFFDPSAAYVGAFGSVNWTANWSSLKSFVYTDVDDQAGSLATSFTLNQNYPNPFNPSTTLSFVLPSAQTVRLSVFNALGQQVDVLAVGQKPAGETRVTWNAGSNPSGIYFYRLEAGNQVITKKMILVK